MESEIGYQRSELAVVFERASGRVDGFLQGIVSRSAKRLQKRGGEDFRKIWKEEWERSAGESELCEEELSVINELATDGYQDVHMQLVQIQMVRERLEEIKRRLEAELQQKSRVYLCVGMLSGMVVSIILI